ncbi:hypothetical protein GQ600_26562 [Phytophthora cactorum]|nr:hypothetical protein GQ600_26562 [Phytophthora cactorum]
MVIVSPPYPSDFHVGSSAWVLFQPCRDDFDEIILEYFRCRCGTVRKQTRRNGFTNLMQHVRLEHPNFEQEMLGVTFAENGVPAELPRRYTTLDPVCGETLRAAMARVAVVVERAIASELPECIGLILDAWTHSSEHYLAVFGCYEIGGKVNMPLLCMASLLNEPNDDLSAVAHREFIAEILPRDFGRQLYQCVFIVGDNCSVNRRLATLVVCR